jgi:hypothetical protein
LVRADARRDDSRWYDATIFRYLVGETITPRIADKKMVKIRMYIGMRL